MKFDLGGGAYLEPDDGPRNTRFHRRIVRIRRSPARRRAACAHSNAGISSDVRQPKAGWRRRAVLAMPGRGWMQLARCEYCGEPLDTISMSGLHHECIFRATAGSVAHVTRRCSCYVIGSTEGDPPGMTLRQAASAALEAWLKKEKLDPANGYNGRVH